jgi:hypothetical protein
MRVMTASTFQHQPDRIERPDITVMQQTTIDDLPHIQATWPPFERLVGLRGRKMYAYVDERRGTYTVCTPVRDDDDPDALSLQVGTLPGGWYLRGRIVGEPPALYGAIGAGMQELKAAAQSSVEDRPLVEFYRRHTEIELWVPIAA